MPAANIWVRPPEPDPDVVATSDPFGNVAHVALQLPTLAEDALATGADPIGVTAAPMTRFQGARNVAITDLSDERLTLVETSGIISIVNTGQEGLEEVYGRFSMKEGFDTGLEMPGSNAAPRSMIDHITHGGRIALLDTPS